MIDLIEIEARIQGLRSGNMTRAPFALQEIQELIGRCERAEALVEVFRAGPSIELRQERDQALALVAEARLKLERTPSALFAEACDVRDAALAEVEVLKGLLRRERCHWAGLIGPDEHRENGCCS